MKWLQNIPDPERYPALMWFGMSQDACNSQRKAYLADKIIGRPQATPQRSVEWLEQNGYVGVYAPEPGQHPAQG